jgi:hypothetical protein
MIDGANLSATHGIKNLPLKEEKADGRNTIYRIPSHAIKIQRLTAGLTLAASAPAGGLVLHLPPHSPPRLEGRSAVEGISDDPPQRIEQEFY